MFKTIRDELYTVVNALTASTDLAHVYNYEPKSLKDWYVSATVSPIESIENIFDTTTNLSLYPFEVSVFMPNDDPENNEWPFLILIDLILVALRANETLSWNALWAIFRIRFGYTADESPLRVCRIQCIYQALNDVN